MISERNFMEKSTSKIGVKNIHEEEETGESQERERRGNQFTS